MLCNEIHLCRPLKDPKATGQQWTTVTQYYVAAVASLERLANLRFYNLFTVEDAKFPPVSVLPETCFKPRQEFTTQKFFSLLKRKHFRLVKVRRVVRTVL